MIADRHHRDDLAPVEEQGERPLHDDSGVDPPSFVIDAGDGAGQPRVVGPGPDGEFFHGKDYVGCCLSGPVDESRDDGYETALQRGFHPLVEAASRSVACRGEWRVPTGAPIGATCPGNCRLWEVAFR